jgi:hypothetical protein
MMSEEMPRVSAAWLRLREPADAAARAPELVDVVRRRLVDSRRPLIHDLGTGTGSMGRWLAPRLPVSQHWFLHDRDADLLDWASVALVDAVVDGQPVTVETRRCDITRLTARDLDGATLVTASALLDLLTADEVERVVTACVEACCPTLLMISVTGCVELTPADPLDAEIAEAFTAHQRRTVGDRTLLGPDAVGATVAAFDRHGVGVRVRPSPWRLGPDQVDLMSEWFKGWLAAACDQRPELARAAVAYSNRRLAEAASGRLRVVVGHEDLLAGCE